MSTAPRPRYSAALHAFLVVAAYSILFTWLFAQSIISHRYLSESDLYEYYLPIFLAPITTWSSFEFSGLPAFADPGDFISYPPHFFFARILGSWTGFVICAFVLAASFTYAYVYGITRSRTAAAFAGLAYGMSEALVERLPHLGTMHSFAWLPLILLSIEGVHGERRRTWITVGGVAVAASFLSGHPQPAVYTVYFTALYALVGGIAERSDRRYYLSVAAMFVLGGVLASIKAIPLVEASFLMARQQVNVEQFTAHGNTPAQMLSILFPTILHEGREAPTYVGLATLVFAFVGASLFRRHWRVAFWMCVAILALVIGAGDATPIPKLLYAIVPLYRKFRVGARHLFLAAFGAAFLAGFAIAAIQRAEVGRVRARSAASAMLALVVAGAAILAAWPQPFNYEVRYTPAWHLPIWNDGVWVQLAIAAITVAAVFVVAQRRRFVASIAILMAILFADNLYSLPYPVGITGLVPITIPSSAVAPSVHAQRLARELQPLRQRALAIGGTHLDAVIPAAFARLWNVPIAGGYGPMLLERYSELATMGTNGSVRPAVLGSDDVALDLLAVRYILVQRDDVAPPGTIERDGVTWDASELGMPIGRPDCGKEYARSTTIPLPPDVSVREIAVVTHLRCSENVPQGGEAGAIRVAVPAGAIGEQQLRAGIETAETGLSDPGVLRRARHQIPPNRFDDPDAGQALRFITRIPLPAPARGGHLELTAPGTGGWLTIDRLTLIDDAGMSHPMSAPGMWLADSARWRAIRHFETSRITDRGVDEPIADEIPYVVYENLRALPRAWVVTDVKALPDSDALEAARRAQLPGGTRFDPRRMAIVDPEEGGVPGPFRPGQGSARVDRIADGRITVNVSTSGGGFLVLSEADYPGWRARIDGSIAPVRRTDVALQGVVVPAGRHTVTFEFASTTKRAGTVLSACGLLVGVMLIAADRRKRPQSAPQNVA